MMAEEDTHPLSGDLESLKDTLAEPTTPAQIPLLEDVVMDGENAPAFQPASRRKRPPPNGDPDRHVPRTSDLFTEQLAHPAPAGLEDGDTQAQLRARADQMVDALVAEYSSEIIRRLRQELTEQLKDVLDDLKAEQ